MKQLNETDVRNVIWGAALYGSGGGGAISAGINLLENYLNTRSDHTLPPITIKTPEEMSDTEYAAVISGMGAPSKLTDKDFSAYAVHAFERLKEISHNENLTCSLAVELGGFNTFVPMLIAVKNNLPVIDADGSGRAVPALDTLLLNLNACHATPLTLANEDASCTDIFLDETCQTKAITVSNASKAEEIARGVCSAYGGIAGLAGWLVSKADLQRENNSWRIPVGTVSRAKDIGAAIHESYPATAEEGSPSVFIQKLTTLGIEAHLICRGIVIQGPVPLPSSLSAQHRNKSFGLIKASRESDGEAFDAGTTKIEDIENSDNVYQITFLNESLIISKQNVDGGFEPIMTAPDIIAVCKADTGMPLTNVVEDIIEGSAVHVYAIKADTIWDIHASAWNTYVQKLGHTAGIIRYPF